MRTTSGFALLTLLAAMPVLADSPYTWCPAALGSADSVSPFELIWDIEDGTTTLGPGQASEHILLARQVGVASRCELDAVLSLTDIFGNTLAQTRGSTDGADTFMLGVGRETSLSDTRQSLRVGAHGTARHCTFDELASLTLVTTLFDVDTGSSCASTACRRVAAERQRQPRFARRVAARATRPLILPPACRSTAVGDSVSPFDLIWDLDDGTTLLTPASETELIVLVTPTLFKACPRARVVLDRLDVRHDGAAAQNRHRSELSIDQPVLVVPLTYRGDGDPAPASVGLTARVAGCSAARPNNLEVRLTTVDVASGRSVASRRLGGVVRRGRPH